MEFEIKTISYKICRACLTMCENGVPICSSNIVDMITACTSVQIWVNDELPNQLCDKCFLQLQNSFNFKQLVETSDMQLRKSLNIDKQDKTETQTAVYIKVERDDNFNADTDQIKNLQINTGNVDENSTQNAPVTKNVKVKLEEHSNANDTILTDHKIASEFKAEYPLSVGSKLENIERLNLKESNGTINKIEDKSDSSKSTRVSCEICKKLVTRQYFKTHIKTHTKQFNCSYCNKVLANQSLLDSHLREFHNAEYILSKTLAENTNKTSDELNQPNQDFWNSNEAQDNSLENCNDTMGDIPDDREPCEVCGKLIVKRQRMRHMEIHSEKRRIFQCNECDKTFFSNQYMQFHLETVHKKIYQFACTVCGKKFHSKSHCERHEAAHRNGNIFHCTYCEKKFNYRKGLTAHIGAVHLKTYKKKSTNRIPCTVCGKLISEQNMNTHSKIHKTERPRFTCPLCPEKKFLCKASLEIHTKFKHENVRPEHLCTICGRRKKTLCELKMHMNTHNTEKKFACKVCGTKFKGYSGVQYHMRSVHLKLKSYTCEICSRSFSADTTLKRHLLIHTGERPYVCSLCQRPFRQKSALETHKKLVHSAEKVGRKKVSGNSVVSSDSSSWTAQ